MSVYISRDVVWFRILGYGMHIKLARSPMLFSERNGYTKTWTLFRLRFKLLKP